MKINKLFLTLLCVGLSAGSGIAQDKLSLKDALGAALKSNYDIRLSKKDFADSKLKKQQRRSRFLSDHFLGSRAKQFFANSRKSRLFYARRYA